MPAAAPNRVQVPTLTDRQPQTPLVPLVVIASSMRGLRQAWQQSLRGFVAVEVADLAQVKHVVVERSPAVLLVDVEFPNLGGVEGVAAIRSLQPSTKIVVLANRPDEKEGLAALKAGACGYCERAFTPALMWR
jgi:DNA-binding NarL/FixJ family response regulator